LAQRSHNAQGLAQGGLHRTGIVIGTVAGAVGILVASTTGAGLVEAAKERKVESGDYTGHGTEANQ